MKRHIERAAHIAKAQSLLGSINRFVATACEIDMVTSAEIAFAIFIAKHNLPMAVGDEFGLLAKNMWCTTVPVAPSGGGKNTNYRFSRIFDRSVPLFRSLMLTPMTVCTTSSKWNHIYVHACVLSCNLRRLMRTIPPTNIKLERFHACVH